MITKTIVSSNLIKNDSKADRCNSLLSVNEVLKASQDSMSTSTGVPEADSSSVVYTDRRTSEMPVQMYAVSESIGSEVVGALAVEAVLDSLLIDVNEYARRKNKADIDIADFADIVSENADHAVRQQLTAWQGTYTGSTLAWIMIEDDTAYTYCVGDGSLFLFRDDHLYRITDLTKYEDIINDSNYLGYRKNESRLMPANLNRMPLRSGDIILLLSSAVTSFISEETLEAILRRPCAFAEVADSICQTARNASDFSNGAVIAVKAQSIEDVKTAKVEAVERPVRKSRIKRMGKRK